MSLEPDDRHEKKLHNAMCPEITGFSVCRKNAPVSSTGSIDHKLDVRHNLVQIADASLVFFVLIPASETECCSRGPACGMASYFEARPDL